MIIAILRKSVDGTVAENTLKHGCGAINIDATRIDTSDNLNGGAYAENPTERHDGKENWRFERGKGEYKQPSGRWPANFILTHREDCELKGTKKIKGNRQDSRPEGDVVRADKSEWRFRPTSATKRGYSDEDGKETIADWACVEGCPVKELDQQSGHLKSGKDVNPTTSKVSGFFGGKDNYYSSKSNYGDEGGASRFFKQFKKGND